MAFLILSRTISVPVYTYIHVHIHLPMCIQGELIGKKDLRDRKICAMAIKEEEEFVVCILMIIYAFSPPPSRNFSPFRLSLMSLHCCSVLYQAPFLEICGLPKGRLYPLWRGVPSGLKYHSLTFATHSGNANSSA